MVMRVSNTEIPSAFIYLGIFYYVALWIKKNVNFKRNSVENPGFFKYKIQISKNTRYLWLTEMVIGHHWPWLQCANYVILWGKEREKHMRNTNIRRAFGNCDLLI